ncbi:MAG: DUF308 domain-containing protein [Burkholderiales bacterium]
MASHISEIALLQLIAAWAVLSGTVEIAASMAVRKEMSGAWPLPVAGAMSVIFGALLMLRLDAGVLALAWMIGLYAFFFGLVLLALAQRLQELASEIASV